MALSSIFPDPTFPVGVRVLTKMQRILVAPPAQALLDSGQVLAFSLSCHFFDRHDQGSWDTAMSVCAPTPDGGAVWCHSWKDLCALDIPELGNAMAALNQQRPTQPHVLKSLWSKGPDQDAPGRHLPDDTTLALLVGPRHTWIGVDDMEMAEPETAAQIKDLLAGTSPLGTLTPQACAQFSQRMATCLLDRPSSLSAHTALCTQQAITQAIPPLRRILGARGSDSSWLANLPLQAPDIRTTTTAITQAPEL